MTPRSGSGQWRLHAALAALPWGLALAITAPLLLGRGFWSFGDMVFTPTQPWKPEWYGGDGGVPRAVPSDALVSLATQVLPGDIVQKVVLVTLLGCAGWGVLRLLEGVHPLAAAAACTFYVWNPYVFERLAIGHWALLCGYAALPWVAAGALHVAGQGRHAWPALLVPMALAAWTSPTGGALAALTSVGVLAVASEAGRRGRAVMGGLGAAAVINLPWLVPGLVSSGAGADASGAAAFAARADTPFGAWGSLLTLGGIWKTSIVPDERGTTLVAAMSLALSVAALVGVGIGWRRARWRPLVLGMAVSAVPVFVLVLVSTTSPGQAMVEWVVTSVPGGGLVRDSQKWLALPALLLALGLGVVGDAYITWCRAEPARPGAWTALVLVLVPVMALPSLAWGNLGAWPRSTYSQEWEVVSALVAADESGLRPSTVVLPFEVYRRFPWNGERAWLDPAPRILPGRVIVDDTLDLGADGSVAGESGTAGVIRHAVGTWAALDRVLDDEGVRFVLVEAQTPGDLPQGDPLDHGLVPVHEGPQLVLYDRGTQTVRESLPGWRLWLLALDAALFAAFLILCVRPVGRLISRNGPARAG